MEICKEKTIMKYVLTSAFGSYGTRKSLQDLKKEIQEKQNLEVAIGKFQFSLTFRLFSLELAELSQNEAQKNVKTFLKYSNMLENSQSQI